MSSSSSQDLSLTFLEQRGIRDPAKRQVVLDALNKNGEIYTVQELCDLFLKGGGVPKLISWGIHEPYAKDLEDFWKEQPIDFEFLKRLGIVEPDDQQVVLRALEAAKIRTYGGLLSSIQEGPESQEVSRLTQKWRINDVFVQMLYKFWRAHNPPTQFQVKKELHRISSLEVQNEGFSGFLSHFFHEVSEKRLRISPNHRILDIGYALFGGEASPTSLYYREVYRKLAPLVLEKLNFRSGAQVLIAGTRGCGKSAFGVVILMQLLQDNETVLYSTRSRRFLIIPEKPKKSHLESLAICFRELYYDTSQIKPGINEFKATGDIDLFQLLTDKDLYHILDLEEDSKSIIPMSNVGRTLIISSPNSDRLGILHSATTMLKLYLPTWTKDEVCEANELIFKLDKNDLMDSFCYLGGVARILFEKKTLNDRLRELHTQIGNLTLSNMQEIFRSSAYENLPNSKSTYLLIHVNPRKNHISKEIDFDDWETKFATEYVSQSLTERFLQDNHFQAQNIIAQVSYIPQCASWRGHMIECFAHHSLTNKRNEFIPASNWCELKQNAKTPNIVLNTCRGIPFTTSEFFTNLKFISFKPHVYYRPRSKNFKTADSFVIVDRATFEKWFPGVLPVLSPNQAMEVEEFYLVVFQVTVSPQHIVDGPQLNLIYHTIVNSGIRLSRIRFLVFLTSENGITTYQAVTYLGRKAEEEEEEEEEMVVAGNQLKKTTKRVKYQDQKQFGIQFALYMDSIYETILKHWQIDQD